MYTYMRLESSSFWIDEFRDKQSGEAHKYVAFGLKFHHLQFSRHARFAERVLAGIAINAFYAYQTSVQASRRLDDTENVTLVLSIYPQDRVHARAIVGHCFIVNSSILF